MDRSLLSWTRVGGVILLDTLQQYDYGMWPRICEQLVGGPIEDLASPQEHQ